MAYSTAVLSATHHMHCTCFPLDSDSPCVCRSAGIHPSSLKIVATVNELLDHNNSHRARPNDILEADWLGRGVFQIQNVHHKLILYAVCIQIMTQMAFDWEQENPVVAASMVTHIFTLYFITHMCFVKATDRRRTIALIDSSVGVERSYQTCTVAWIQPDVRTSLVLHASRNKTDVTHVQNPTQSRSIVEGSRSYEGLSRIESLFIGFICITIAFAASGDGLEFVFEQCTRICSSGI
jgi:hypothetical protein